MTTWFITGCSTGFGRSLAEQVLASGANAVITARDTSTIEDLGSLYPDTSLVLPLDVRNTDHIISATDAALEHFGAIDVLLNNAGYGYRSAVEEGEREQIDAVFATNFFGAINVTNALLPSMRERGSGMIINISSIAAQRSASGSGYYAATKAALESVSEALRQEVAPLGIRVSCVQPGPFRTDFAGRSLHQSAEPIDAYTDTAGRRRKEHDTIHGNQAGDPDKAALAIMQLAQIEKPPFRLVLGREALQLAERDLNRQLDDLMDWENLTLSTDFQN